jgi:hypothetical protein
MMIEVWPRASWPVIWCSRFRRRCAVAVRDWYRMLRYKLTEASACAACGTLVAGGHDGPAGQWGARRLPLLVGG